MGYRLKNGREVYIVAVHAGWRFPKTDDVPEQYRGREFTARFGTESFLSEDTVLVLETEGIEEIVIHGAREKSWTSTEKKLVELVQKIVPRGL